MPLHAFGLNHQTAPVALREKLAYSAGELDRALAALRALPGVAEAALVSTCNRTEVYAELAAGAEQGVVDWLGAESGAGAALEGYLYRHRDADAVRHLYRVATGLDSMVLGEPQILGQVKEAWHAARAAGALGPPLDRLFQQAFAVAKRVRTDTRIGAHPVSVAFAAVRLARQRFTDLEQATVLLIGAGDTVELAARHLADAKVRNLLVANRTLEHAQPLAQRHGGFALPLTELARHLPEADIVLSATASREPILGVEAVREALKARRHRPMLFLDLAVPRDIDPAVGQLADAYLYTVDDLEQAIESNRASRREAAAQAEAIIEVQVEHYMSWWAAQGRQDALRRLRADAEAHRAALLDKARAQVAAGEPADAVLERLARQLTNKLLHAPSAALRQAALDGDADLLRAAERLYAPPAAADPTMTPGLRRKLESLAERHEEVGRLLADASVLADNARFRALSKEYAQLEPVTKALADESLARRDLAAAEGLRNDPEMRELAEEEIAAAQNRLAQLDGELALLLIPKDPRDESSLFLEVRAGTGGDEAAIFAGDLFRMYARYAERQGWKVEVESSSPGEHGGFKEIVARVDGRGAFSRLKYESGTHRVQRVPETEAQGRIHTSAATVAILSDDEEVEDVAVNPADLKVDTFRSSGAGGQHVNKTDSAIRITHLPSGLVVECQTERSQHANRDKAMKRLKAQLLDAQRAKQAAAQAASRRLQVGSGDRSQRIRTYNFPQGRITDHRVEGLTLYALPQVLAGDLDELVSVLAREAQADELRILTEAA